MGRELTEEQIEELRLQMGYGQEISTEYISCRYISPDTIWEKLGMQTPVEPVEERTSKCRQSLRIIF